MALEPKQKYLLICAAIVIGTMFAFFMRMRMYSMPGTSYTGALPALTDEEAVVRNHLSSHVDVLAKNIGERSSVVAGSLDKAADYIIQQLKTYGYTANDLKYETDKATFRNIEVLIPGTDSNKGSIVVGAHYDCFAGSVGANDNASGVGALLEMARLFDHKQHLHPIRLVFFANSEPPLYYKTEKMGSYQYLQRCEKENIKISAMISIDEIGYFPDVIETQHYPSPLNTFYTHWGNFLSVVGDPASEDLTRELVGDFRSLVKFPCEGVVAQDPFSNGMENSDHYWFWKKNIPAVWISDTVFYRYPNYHSPKDTWEQVDVDKECRVVIGLKDIIEDLADKNN